MTKAIRIENADLSPYPVRVTLQTKNAAGEWVDEPSHTQLDHSTQMTTQYIHSGRRMIVEEVSPGTPFQPSAALTHEQLVNAMTSRFLAWSFPVNLNPDGGITIKEGSAPVGTNLLDYEQAKAMVTHLIAGLL